MSVVSIPSPNSPLPRQQSAELRIAEIYAAEQGEGMYAGTPSVFLRTTGCNLRCWYCDTPHTSWSPEGETLALDEILERITRFDCEHVVVTGGEPFLQPAITSLTAALKRRGSFVTVETAGTLYRPVAADLISLSPKLSNSTPADEPWNLRHDQLRHNPGAIAQLRAAHRCQWKFVVDTPDDLAEIDSYVRVAKIPDGEVWLMPQARSAEEILAKTDWIQLAADERGWHVSPRLHIERYGNVRGT